MSLTKYIKTPRFYSLIGAWNPQQVNKNWLMTVRQLSQNRMSKNVKERGKWRLLWRDVEKCVAPPFGGSENWWLTEKPRFFGIAIIFSFLLKCQIPANHCKTDLTSVWARTRNPIQCFKSMRKPCQSLSLQTSFLCQEEIQVQGTAWVKWKVVLTSVTADVYFCW